MTDDNATPHEPKFRRTMTDAALAGNRANAQKSSGPRTPEGKARSCMNRLKHGLYSRTLAQPHEDTSDAQRIDGEPTDMLAAMDADARVERIPRMDNVTDDKPLSQSDRQIVLNNIRDFVRVKQLISIKELARMARCAPSTVSEVINSKYKGDVDEILRRLDSALANFARSQDGPEPAQFVRTRFAERIFGILKLTAKMRTMSAFYCVSGSGKSMALKAARALDFKNAIYLECNPGTASPLALLQALVRKLELKGINPTAIRKAEAFNLLVRHLMDSGVMLLIDEADCLPSKCLNVLRQLHDATSGRMQNPCTVVLAGRPNLREAIDRASDCREIGGSLRGRISIEHDLMPSGGANPADGGKWLFSVEEITAMLAKRRVKIARDAARWLCCLANLSLLTDGREDGGPRIAIKVAINAAALNKTGEAITVQMLKQAYRLAKDRTGAVAMEQLIESAMRYAPTTTASAAG